MAEENDKKQPAENAAGRLETKPSSPPPQDVQTDADERSYPGQLDKVEGKMHNGELGGNLEKEEG